MDRDGIGAGEQLVERRGPNTRALELIVGNERVVSRNVHAERGGALGERSPDPAEADHPQPHVGDPAKWSGGTMIPTARPHAPVELDDPTHEGERSASA